MCPETVTTGIVKTDPSRGTDCVGADCVGAIWPAGRPQRAGAAGGFLKKVGWSHLLRIPRIYEPRAQLLFAHVCCRGRTFPRGDFTLSTRTFLNKESPEEVSDVATGLPFPYQTLEEFWIRCAFVTITITTSEKKSTFFVLPFFSAKFSLLEF